MIVINVLVFAVLEILGDTEDGAFMAAHGALSAAAIEEGKYYCLLTAMFLHFGFAHLVNNMFVLFFTGRYLEQEIGSVWFTVLYLLGGLFGNVVSFLTNYESGRNVGSAGASGAVFAAIGGMFLLVLLKCGRLSQLRTQSMVIMVVLSVYQGYTTVGVDNTAHVAGLFAGIVIAGLYYLVKRRNGGFI